MKDIQNLRDDRRINIRKVGVKTISYPITVLDRAKRVQQTVATVNMYVNLPHRFKGTHMSRFVEILNRFHGRCSFDDFHIILQEMKERLEAEAAHLEIEFPYFPQTDHSGSDIGVDRYQCRMHGSLEQDDDLVLEIEVPIHLPGTNTTSGELPRSMGRWGLASVSVRFYRFVWIEELIELIEDSLAGCIVTAGSVESVCRSVGHVLSGHPDISWFRVVVENLAHGFSIFASISEDKSAVVAEDSAVSAC